MQFDLLSFLIGLLAAGGLVALLYYFRKELGQAGERLRAAITHGRASFTSGADQRYRDDVLELWQKAHLAGTILRLDDIAIAPHFLADAPLAEPNKEIEPDITYVVPATIDYPELPALFQAPGYSLRDLARAPHNLVIVGRPGAGKTIALTLIGLRAAALDAGFFPKPVLPVMAHAGDLQLPLADKADISQPIVDAAEWVSGISGAALPDRIIAALKDGSALILLDGLDDLPHAQQALVFAWLKIFTTVYGKNRIIAAASHIGYAPLLALGFVEVVIGGWSGEDYRALVNKWVAAWPAVAAAHKRGRRSTDDPDPALVAGWLSGGTVARTPFTVTLKVWTGLAGDAEGPRTIDWLETYVKRLSKAPEARKALERAAAEMLSQERYGLPRDRLAALINAARAETANPSAMDPQDVLDEMAGRGGLLARRAGSRYSISHSITAAYLAAKSVALGPSPDETLAAVHPLPSWTRALRFVVALAGERSKDIAASRLSAPPDAVHSDLFAVAAWLADAPPNAPWRADTFRRLAQLFIAPTTPIQLRSRAVCALIASRDETVAKLFKQSLAAPDPLTRQYSAVALGALSDSTAVGEIAKLLADSDLYVRWAAALALAVIGDQASIEALGTALLEGDEGLRRAACEALALHPSEGHAMLREAIMDNEMTIRRGAVAGLRRVGNQPWVLELLNQTFMDDSQWIVQTSAEAAAKELREPPDHFPQPVPVPEQTGWLAAYAAGKGKGVPIGPDAQMMLLQALRDGKEAERIAAADHLGRTAAADVLPALRAAIHDSAPGVRETAYQALANIAFATGQKVTL